MAPHLSPAELDWMQKLDRSGKTPVQIHASLTARRSRRHVVSPNLTNIRKAIKGLTYKRGPKETRGRKPTYSKKWVKALNTARKKLLLTCAQSREVRWRDVVQKARAPKAHRSTVKRAFDRDGVKVAARRPREKPHERPGDEQRLGVTKSEARIRVEDPWHGSAENL